MGVDTRTAAEQEESSRKGVFPHLLIYDAMAAG
jgi:hypothetical protein